MAAMTIMTDDDLLRAVEEFLARTSMAHTRLGREVMGDGSLVQHLRAGRSLSLRNAEKLMRFMTEYEATNTTDRAA